MLVMKIRWRLGCSDLGVGELNAGVFCLGRMKDEQGSLK